MMGYEIISPSRIVKIKSSVHKELLPGEINFLCGNDHKKIVTTESKYMDKETGLIIIEESEYEVPTNEIKH